MIGRRVRERVVELRREPKRAAGSKFTIRRALGASLFVHLLILLILRWLPSATAQVAVPPPEDVEVRFELPAQPRAEDEPSDLMRSSGPAPDSAAPSPANPRPSILGEPEPTPPTTSAQMAPATPPPIPAPSSRQPESQPPSAEPTERPALDLPDRDGAIAPAQRPPAREPAPSIRERMRDFLRSAPESQSQPSEASPTSPPGSRQGLDLPDLDRLPVSGFGMDRNLVFESTDYDWSDYSRQIYMAIWRAWHNRLWATAERFERWSYVGGQPFLEHQVVVRFTIEETGEVTAIQILLPSGCEPLDASAADALAEVVLPPLPEDFPRTREHVRARFVATGEIKSMRRYLDYLKGQGWF